LAIQIISFCLGEEKKKAIVLIFSYTCLMGNQKAQILPFKRRGKKSGQLCRSSWCIGQGSTHEAL